MVIEKRKKPDNILLVANYKSDVGYAWWLMENFWAEISLHFNKIGRKCILLYPKVNEIPESIKQSFIIIIEHDFSDKSIRSIGRLSNIVKQYGISYVYLTDKPYCDWLYLKMRLDGVVKIVNHDHTPGERNAVSPLKRCVKKMIHSFEMFSCDHYVGVSSFVKKRAVEIACVPEGKTSFIHNGIRIFGDTKTDYAHDIFCIPSDSKIVVTTGRASFYKGIDLLIRCAHILIRERNVEKLYFLFIGSGPDLQKFKDLAALLDIEDKFIFAGFRTDVHKILPSCDIGVQVSLGEAFSLSIIEYMCAGLVTLVPNNCGNSEAIVDGVNGVLFAPGNLDDLVSKILSVLCNEELSHKLSKAAHKRVVEKFNIERCNENLISLLDKQFT